MDALAVTIVRCRPRITAATGEAAPRAGKGLLACHGITGCMSRNRDYWDNTFTAGFFETINVELADRRSWVTRAGTRRAMAHYIELFYDSQLLHPRPGHVIPGSTKPLLSGRRLCQHRKTVIENRGRGASSGGRSVGLSQ